MGCFDVSKYRTFDIYRIERVVPLRPLASPGFCADVSRNIQSIMWQIARSHRLPQFFFVHRYCTNRVVLNVCSFFVVSVLFVATMTASSSVGDFKVSSGRLDLNLVDILFRQ